jgi:quercetin dioxygenase-like cupin family protein
MIRDLSEVLENIIGDDPRNWVDDIVSEKDLNHYIYPNIEDVQHKIRKDQSMKKQETANTSLKENRTHGTVQYPIALYEWNGENEWHVVPHWHEEMEWIYFQKGDFPVWINTKEYQVHAPAFMCIHPEELHALILEKDGIESAVVFPVDILCFERYDAAEAKVLGPLAEGKLRMPVHEPDTLLYLSIPGNHLFENRSIPFPHANAEPHATHFLRSIRTKQSDTAPFHVFYSLLTMYLPFPAFSCFGPFLFYAEHLLYLDRYSDLNPFRSLCHLPSS